MRNATEQQATKLVATLVEHNKLFTEAPADQVQWAIQNSADAVSLFCQALKGRANGVAKTEIDSVVRVDRLVRPAYPGWMKEVLHTELEKTGSAEYYAVKLELWLHEGQKNGKWVKGQKIYEHLKENKMLESCLSLSDLLAIQAKGITFFRQHFASKAVFGWKSVVRHRDGSLFVPYLYGDGKQVVLRWLWLEVGWLGNNPALRFAS